MTEQQRLHYLAALGIETYIPKRVLSHASVSAPLVAYEPASHVDDRQQESNEPLDDTLAAVTPVADTVTANPEVTGLLEAGHVEASDYSETAYDDADSSHGQNDPSNDALKPATPNFASPNEAGAMPHEQAVNSNDAPSKAAPQTPPAIVSGTNAKPLRFTLSVWTITPSLLVIDTRQTGSALPTDKLLQNILRAVGYPQVQLPPSELVRWPIFKQDPQANNSEEAFAMVQANIGARCAKTPGLHILLMGETAAEFAVGGLEQYVSYEQQLGQMVPCAIWQASAIVLPSLVEILETPSKKALVWQALQPLLNAEH